MGGQHTDKLTHLFDSFSVFGALQYICRCFEIWPVLNTGPNSISRSGPDNAHSICWIPDTSFCFRLDFSIVDIFNVSRGHPDLVTASD